MLYNLSFDLSSIDIKLDWSLIKLFAHDFELIKSESIFQSSIKWNGSKTFAKITGYFRPVSSKGSYRVRSSGLVLFRMRKCNKHNGICFSAEKLIMQDSHTDKERAR